jgi:hypothetical protein
MHQFVCGCRLAHIVQLKRISRLGFQCLGVNHARSTRAMEASSGWVSREAFPTNSHDGLLGVGAAHRYGLAVSSALQLLNFSAGMAGTGRLVQH